MSLDLTRRLFLSLPAAAAAARMLKFVPAALAAEPGEWISMFDGKSLDGWKANEHADTWRVEDGCLVANGPRSHLFYEGPVGDADFRNFEIEVVVKTTPGANSGIYFHTEPQATGWPDKGYEVQINNTYSGVGNYRELKRTGSLYDVRNIYHSAVADNEWFRVRVRVAGRRICVWVNDYPTVDYIEPEGLAARPGRAGRILSHGTIALQGHDPGSRVAYRRVAVRLLPDDADASKPERASDEGYGLTTELMDRLAAARVPVIDYHVHIRGGMTVEKAMDRQAVTGINVGVLRNIGAGWEIETDEQLAEFLESATGRPLCVGLQVNDRDWYTKHPARLLGQLDYALGDTMIMPMPNDDSPPVKLWMGDLYTIDDAEAWMERYVRHNLRVLAEPITILANPTYLPPPVKDQYDRLWTDERMRTIIRAAIDNGVALEINGGSGLPSDRFVKMAKEMGAKFSFGSNNFDDKPIAMARCFEAIDRFKLTKDDMYIPQEKLAARLAAKKKA